MYRLMKSQHAEVNSSDSKRHPMLNENDINFILVNGAQMALSKLKRSPSFNARIYYYAEIGVYLEVSLSRGAGITDETREQLQEIHQSATRDLMNENKKRAMVIHDDERN